MVVRALLRAGGEDSDKGSRPDAAAEAAGAARERAHGLLRDLLTDLEGGADTPEPPLSLTGARLRRLGRGPVVAGLAVGVLSFSGVAAASTQVAAGNPLHGLGSVVRTAAGAFASLGAPARSSSTDGPSSGPAGLAAPTPAEEVAERQVDELLRTADELFAAGRVDEAWAQLELAEQALGGMPEAAGTSARKDEAKALRARLKADGAGSPASGDDREQGAPGADDPGKTSKDSGPEAPGREAPVLPQAPAAGAPAPQPPAAEPAAPKAPAAPAPAPPAPAPPAPAPPAPASTPSTSKPSTSKPSTSKPSASKPPASKPPSDDDNTRPGSGDD